WCEWRRHGTGLPLIVACALPLFVLGMACTEHRPEVTLVLLILTLPAPVLFAGVAGLLVSKNNPSVRDYYGVSPFTATRPLSCAALVGARLKAAVLSTLITWALMALVITLTVLLTERLQDLEHWWQRWHAAWPAAKVWGTVLLTAAGLLVLTWRRL